ncbi:hypothetical protein CTAM01_03447 [Colletotrichum tamarilloi]|uniref:Uncharacterized protein n=1 Tax=Colletotrichum tamarilloi TaxID=1209934 RepID=A0ABQ9RK67_9PEZI|nr:uncharacterized protein CTAM01_03447 [Colletotrichum tamarilloi]KAK1506112.1 hypothetical protein CTAM01_03447 [Colletotrichum tamarilloi]
MLAYLNLEGETIQTASNQPACVPDCRFSARLTDWRCPFTITYLGRRATALPACLALQLKDKHYKTRYIPR